MIFDILDKYIELYNPEISEGYYKANSNKFVVVSYGTNGLVEIETDYQKGKEKLATDLPFQMGRSGFVKQANVCYEHCKWFSNTENYHIWKGFHLSFLKEMKSVAATKFVEVLESDSLLKLKTPKSGWVIFRYAGQSNFLHELPEVSKKWKQEYSEFLWGQSWLKLSYYQFLKNETVIKDGVETSKYKDTDDKERTTGFFAPLNINVGQTLIPFSFNVDSSLPWNITQAQMFELYRNKYASYMCVLSLLYSKGNVKSYKTGDKSYTSVLYVSEKQEAADDFFDSLFDTEEVGSIEENPMVENFFEKLKRLELAKIPEDGSTKIYFEKWGTNQKRMVSMGGGEILFKDVYNRYQEYINSIEQNYYNFKTHQFKKRWPQFWMLMKLFDTDSNKDKSKIYQQVYFDDFLNHILLGSELPRKLYHELIESIRMKSFGAFDPYFAHNALSLLNVFYGKGLEPVDAIRRAIYNLGKYNGIAKHIYDRVRISHMPIYSTLDAYSEMKDKFHHAVDGGKQLGIHVGKYLVNKNNYINAYDAANTSSRDHRGFSQTEFESYIQGAMRGYLDMAEYKPKEKVK